MMYDRNPVVLLRKAAKELKGLHKVEEWSVYLAVAALCAVLAMLFALQWSAASYQKETTVRGQRHIVLQDAAMAARLREAAARPAEAGAAETPQQAAAETGGDWYYDAVYKDWRYKKK